MHVLAIAAVAGAISVIASNSGIPAATKAPK
jgi:hypothetical protein